MHSINQTTIRLWFLSHTLSVSSLKKIVFSPRSMNLPELCAASEANTGKGRPRVINDLPGLQPTPTNTILFVSCSPPPTYYWLRQAGMAMDDHKIQCWKHTHDENTGFRWNSNQSTVKPRHPPSSTDFSSSSIKLQPTSIVTLTSNMTPDLIFHSRSWKSTTACCPRNAIWCNSLCNLYLNVF